MFKCGIKPSDSKIRSLRAAPQDVRITSSYSGIIVQSILYQASTSLTYLLHQPAHQNTKFEWTFDCETSFQTFNHYVTDRAINIYFDKK